MAKPEQCSHCSKSATIHLTQIVNNKINKIDLCEDCPFKKGVTESEGFSLADFLIKGPMGLNSDASDQIACKSCDFTPADFKKVGRFGCPDCYENFKDIINPMLTNMHKDTVHRGKIPKSAIARIGYQRKFDDLNHRLSKAIQEEDYEEAAKIRDQIQDLKGNTTSSKG